MSENTNPCRVRVEYVDSRIAVYEFPTEQEAKAFCDEEFKSASTLRVLCSRLGIDQSKTGE